MYVTGSFDSIGGIGLNNIARFNGFLTKIGGNVYYDSNTNCIKESSEKGIESRLIKIEPGQHYVCSNSNGKYEAYIDTGNITLSMLPHNGAYKYWVATGCNNSVINKHFIGGKDTSNNFAIIPIPNIIESRIFLTGLSGFIARPGRNEDYILAYENIGTATVSTGNVNLILDPKVQLKTTNPSYTSYNHPNASWSFTNLHAGEKRFINLTIRVDTSLSVNDSLRFYASIQPTIGDSDITNNFDTLKQRIVTAIDPNDKQCSPDGDILPQTSKINYLIRFQNTGNYPAYRVRVVDTVTENLPLTKILIKTSSHPYELKVTDNVLTWTFNNIMLPDSGSNEQKSHGYISYTAFIKPGLAIGTKITNKAYIYFDYQPPVITRSTVNTIALPNAIEEPEFIGKCFKVFPNPTTDCLNIEYLGKSGNSEIIIFNFLGKELIRSKVYPNYLLKVETGSLPSGIYFLRDADATFFNKIIVTH